jgi:hypothetical protein
MPHNKAKLGMRSHPVASICTEQGSAFLRQLCGNLQRLVSCKGLEFWLSSLQPYTEE